MILLSEEHCLLGGRGLHNEHTGAVVFAFAGEDGEGKVLIVWWRIQ